MVCHLFQNYDCFDGLILLEPSLKIDLVFVANLQNQLGFYGLHKNWLACTKIDSVFCEVSVQKIDTVFVPT